MLVKLHFNKKNQSKLRKCLAGRKFLDQTLTYLSLAKSRK